MIFGNAAWGLRETPLKEQLRITRDMGLKVLELGIANAPNDVPLDVTYEELTEIKELAAEYGGVLMCAATGNDFTNGSADIEKVKKVIDICEELNISYLRIFAGFTALQDVTEAMYQSMLDSLSTVCEYAKEKDIIPVIETHGGVNSYEDGVEHFHSTTTDMKSLKRIMDSLPENVKICFDPANLYAVGHAKPEVFYQEFKERIGYAHFKDFKKLPSGHLKPSYCGDSDMNWDAILKAMEDFGGVALFEYENVEDVEEGLRMSYEYIKGKSGCMSPLDYAIAACDTMMRKFVAEDLPPKGHFHYHQGVFLSGVYHTYLACKDEKYFDYLKAWVDSVMDEDGKILNNDNGKLDDLQPGILLFPILERSDAAKYKNALEGIMKALAEAPRVCEGGYAHNAYTCLHQIWLDSLYMMGPICAQYARKYDKPEFLEFAVQHAYAIFDKTLDAKSGLLYHAWDSVKEKAWANPETGLAPEFWGRSIGWVPVAMIDIMDEMDEASSDYKKLTELLKNLLNAICRYQSDDGRWYQVVDKGDQDGNWLENSCSCLFVAAIARAVDKGILDIAYLKKAWKGYDGVINSLSWEGNDLLVGQICIGTGVGDYAHYCNRPTSTNDLHGMGAFLLMCIAMQKVYDGE